MKKTEIEAIDDIVQILTERVRNALRQHLQMKHLCKSGTFSEKRQKTRQCADPSESNFVTFQVNPN